MFKAEQNVLNEAQLLIEQDRASANESVDAWRSAYIALCDQFASLLRDSMKLTAAGDLSYRRLIKAKEEIERLNRENYHLAIFDSLTEVNNRYYLMDQYGKEFAKALRHDSPLALILIDLDHFKQINDEFGHQVGDEVLRSVSQRIKGQVRQQDTFGRYGGEEFLLILPGIEVADAALVAEKIRTLVSADPFAIGVHKITITISLGLAQFSSTRDVNRDVFLLRADQAMYEAKIRGRNQMVIDGVSP